MDGVLESAPQVGVVLDNGLMGELATVVLAELLAAVGKSGKESAPPLLDKFGEIVNALAGDQDKKVYEKVLGVFRVTFGLLDITHAHEASEGSGESQIPPQAVPMWRRKTSQVKEALLAAPALLVSVGTWASVKALLDGCEGELDKLGAEQVGQAVVQLTERLEALDAKAYGGAEANTNWHDDAGRNNEQQRSAALAVLSKASPGELNKLIN